MVGAVWADSRRVACQLNSCNRNRRRAAVADRLTRKLGQRLRVARDRFKPGRTVRQRRAELYNDARLAPLALGPFAGDVLMLLAVAADQPPFERQVLWRLLTRPS